MKKLVGCVGSLVIFGALFFVLWGAVKVWHFIMDPPARDWQAVERLLRDGKHVIADVKDIAGRPDSVTEPPLNYRGPSASCYWWGREGLLVGSDDEVLGTCFYSEKRE
jgi:hypothetical protein